MKAYENHEKDVMRQIAELRAFMEQAVAKLEEWDGESPLYHFNREGRAIEVIWENCDDFYLECVPGLGGDAGLYRDMRNDNVVGIFLPVPEKWAEALEKELE